MALIFKCCVCRSTAVNDNYFFLQGCNPTYLITGPSDFGGYCPEPTYQYTYEGADFCCCSDGCCWDRCLSEVPPNDCIEVVPNSKWEYNDTLGYHQAKVEITGTKVIGV